MKNRGLLDYSLLVSIESTECEFDPESIVEKRALAKKVMRSQQEKIARAHSRAQSFVKNPLVQGNTS